ncbi:calcium uniporter protein 4, mitochondrial [Impatiens glandulifera]|uniref:calcium uniporter protein 4, mitochondrial n=1 Tax=Impatiens glandulifera TaxID=253017 RepID=UPI001FB157ED|nr:calcium uniporter protein 4, mitochondrial [Impatiens glandulifera]
MAIRRTLAKRLFNYSGHPFKDQITLESFPISSSSSFQKHLIPHKEGIYRETPANSKSDGNVFIRRFNQAARLPEFLTIPDGEKLRHALRSINLTEGINLPLESFGGMSVLEQTKKILRSSKLEKLRSELRSISSNSISYSEYTEFCVNFCGGNREQGIEFAKLLDASGNVVVLDDAVFLRPDQVITVAKSMKKLIADSMAKPNDPRRKELEEMDNQIAGIDRKAEGLVRAELYGGLAFLVLQTSAFVRLTFWELDWDVMEPICFFATYFPFLLGYVFYLKTYNEPCFEGYFQRRFRTKQRKLMEKHKFDIQRYNELCKAFDIDCRGKRGSLL